MLRGRSEKTLGVTIQGSISTEVGHFLLESEIAEEKGGLDYYCLDCLKIQLMVQGEESLEVRA